MSLVPGTMLGPFEIIAPLGAGGMGEVWRARDSRLGREVAVKVLPAEFAADPERLKRFEREARATAALSHPNILAVHDVGTHEGVPYLVEELLEGESLKERLDRGSLGALEALRIAGEIAKGLAAAHEKGIVHRDLKPDNVFLTRDGTVKVLDFGLAKLLPTVPADEAETLSAAATATTRWGACSARWHTWRRSRRGGGRSTSARTCSRSGWCCTRCWRGRGRSRGLPGPR